MTVRCPACGTLYRRPARTAHDGATFRCVRCNHEFDAAADDDAEPGPVAVTEPSAEEGAAFGEEDDDADRFTFGDADAEEEPAAEFAEAAAAPPPRRSGSPPRFAARMLVLVTLGYALLSAYLYTHVDAAHRILGEVPLIGPRLVERRLSPAVVQLAGLRGEYLRVQGDQLVFAISGTAVNGASIPVRGLRVEGWVSGAAEVRHSVSLGARPRQIADLTVREIGLLQSLEPPATWSLAPGETVDFLIVFPGPAEDLREFGARVVSVRAARRPG